MVKTIDIEIKWTTSAAFKLNFKNGDESIATTSINPHQLPNDLNAHSNPLIDIIATALKEVEKECSADEIDFLFHIDVENSDEKRKNLALMLTLQGYLELNLKQATRVIFDKKTQQSNYRQPRLFHFTTPSLPRMNLHRHYFHFMNQPVIAGEKKINKITRGDVASIAMTLAAATVLALTFAPTPLTLLIGLSLLAALCAVIVPHVIAANNNPD